MGHAAVGRGAGECCELLGVVAFLGGVERLNTVDGSATIGSRFNGK